MRFRATDRRTSKGPIYRDDASRYELLQDTDGWYGRDDSGFMFVSKLRTLREAVEEAEDWQRVEMERKAADDERSTA